MAIGFGNVDNFQETIQATVDNAVDFARNQLYKYKESLDYCLDCDEEIPEERKKLLTGVCYCVKCKTKHESTQTSYYNRRGSKDSQLR